MLHYIEDVRDITDVLILKEKQVNQKEIELATSLVDNLTGSFKDINQSDIFRDYIEKMAEMKATGQVVTIEDKRPVMTTGGLVEALQQSILLSKAGVGKGPEVPKVPVEVKLHIKQQLDKEYGVTEEEINDLILQKKIEDEQERLNVLVELQKYKSFEDYVKEHGKEFERLSISEDYCTITIEDDKYPRINLHILKKIGVVADHFGILIYIRSSKNKISPIVNDEDILKLNK
jgi:hypothetical protein